MPVWPICFCSCWPKPPPPIRLPAPMMPMSFIDTPPSWRAPCTASAARSTVSLSGCFPNLVMWMPRIQMSSLALIVLLRLSVAGRFEPEADGFLAVIVLTQRVRRQADLHVRRDVVGIGLHVDEVAAHGRA